MGCGASKQETNLQRAAGWSKRDNSAVDLIQLLEAWALDRFLGSATSKQKQIRRQHLAYRFDWSKMKVLYHPAVYSQDPLHPDRGLQQTAQAEQEFENELDVTIKHTFTFNCQTKCIGQVSLSTGVYFPGMDITMPEYKGNHAARKFPHSVTLGSEGTLSKTIEETVTWSQNSEIPIEPNQTVLATLSVLEKERHQKFTVTTVMTGGPLVVRISDTTTQEFVTSLQGELSEILRDLNLPDVHIDGRKVTFVTSGTSYFKFDVRTKEGAKTIGTSSSPATSSSGVSWN